MFSICCCVLLNLNLDIGVHTDAIYTYAKIPEYSHSFLNCEYFVNPTFSYFRHLGHIFYYESKLDLGYSIHISDSWIPGLAETFNLISRWVTRLVVGIATVD